MSKPRASGDDPERIVKHYWYSEVNPARAGMIPMRSCDEPSSTSKPRASGDDPYRSVGANIAPE